MKRFQYYQFGYLFICCLLFSCDNDINIFPKKFKSQDFPFVLNSYWEYRFEDALRDKVDTVRATVIAQDVSISGVHDLWMLEWKGKHLPILDTQYVKFTDSLIAFYDYSRFHDSLKLESQYSFPFQHEDEWIVADNQGTYYVESSKTESSHFGKDFGKGFYIQRRARGEGNFSIHDNVVLVKGVGIAYRIINVTKGVPRRIDSYFLLDYHLE